RKAVTDWARQNHALILSDEVFHDLHFEEDGVPHSFLDEPGPERVAVMGSLSKSFIAGLRVGWIISSEERIRTLTRIKKTMDLGCPPLIQGIAREFLDTEYESHRHKVSALYRERRDRTLSALARHMPDGVTWTRPQGGFQLWVTLPAPYSSVALFLRGIDNGVAFLPGPLQDINNRFVSSFRLCYGSLAPEIIETGIERLAKTVKHYLSRPPSENGLTGLGDF
ncbi:MAG TPA: PLP-dependent aminotransferase family protein, partial [Treponemataceae bacterium]|nr:PLP-dependent aminotransferase family protein [Treponemataceae bacterium]